MCSTNTQYSIQYIFSPVRMFWANLACLLFVFTAVQSQKPGSLTDNAIPKMPMEVCQSEGNCQKGRDLLSLQQRVVQQIVYEVIFLVALSTLNFIKYSHHLPSCNWSHSGRKLAVDPRQGRLRELLHWKYLGPGILSGRGHLH